MAWVFSSVARQLRHLMDGHRDLHVQLQMVFGVHVCELSIDIDKAQYSLQGTRYSYCNNTFYYGQTHTVPLIIVVWTHLKWSVFPEMEGSPVSY